MLIMLKTGPLTEFGKRLIFNILFIISQKINTGKYTGSKRLGIAPYSSVFKPNYHFTIVTGIKGTVAYFAFTLIIFYSLFIFIQKHSIYGVAPDLTYLK